MNVQNYEYLKDQLFYSGFGNQLQEDLRNKIAKGKNEFQLQLRTKLEGEEVKAELHFSRSKQTDMYFFNSYRLELPADPSRTVNARKFYVNGNERFTLKEAYNLLNGRSVQKLMSDVQGESYRAWYQLDSKTMDIQGNNKLLKFHENYGYDLEKQLQRYPIEELADERSRKRMLDSLCRGNRQLVTFNLSGGRERLYVEALPRFKAVCIFNEQGIRQEFIDDRTELDQRPSAKLQELQRQVQVKARGAGKGGHRI